MMCVWVHALSVDCKLPMLKQERAAIVDLSVFVGSGIDVNRSPRTCRCLGADPGRCE